MTDRPPPFPMIQVTAFAFTFYPVTDLARARGFYEGLLGLKPGTTWEADGIGWIEYELGDGCLAITNSARDRSAPCPNGPTLTLEVADLTAAMAALHAAGIRTVMEVQDFPSCSFAVVLDPDGNALGLHRRKSQA
jgi:predicted enzyme related to lactoylglutathione lyase